MFFLLKALRSAIESSSQLQLVICDGPPSLVSCLAGVYEPEQTYLASPLGGGTSPFGRRRLRTTGSSASVIGGYGNSGVGSTGSLAVRDHYYRLLVAAVSVDPSEDEAGDEDDVEEEDGVEERPEEEVREAPGPVVPAHELVGGNQGLARPGKRKVDGSKDEEDEINKDNLGVVRRRGQLLAEPEMEQWTSDTSTRNSPLQHQKAQVINYQSVASLVDLIEK
ncbi:unnamed protein product [Protopolystoma xenopodis]|uniref:Uncharacterized protein n=1 Tax=Protopolystoma xenopodis TaxID=117903 RepID=A0A448XFR9_9PLAT|nr:unnamed protein product [Protopolystoma xenopodis]